MADQASQYHRGEMDIQEQVATFNLFNDLTKWGSLATTALLVLLTIWFCTPAGFIAGFVSAIIVTIAGVLLLRDGGGH